MFSLKQRGDLARKRGNDLAHRWNNGHAFTQQTAGEGAIRHLVEGQHAAGHRRQNIVFRRRRDDDRLFCLAARHAGEEGQYAGENESHTGAD